MFDSHAYSIPYFKQILGKFTDCELLFIFNHFPISSYSVFIFLNLLCEFYPDYFDLLLLLFSISLQFLYSLFETLYLSLLFIEEYLDLLNVFLTQLIIIR